MGRVGMGRIAVGGGEGRGREGRGGDYQTHMGASVEQLTASAHLSSIYSDSSIRNAPAFYSPPGIAPVGAAILFRLFSFSFFSFPAARPKEKLGKVLAGSRVG